MRIRGLAWRVLTLAAATASAQAQNQPDVNGLRTSLTEILSLVTLGSVSVPDTSVTVSQTGGKFQLRLPLKGFIAPADAAAEADVQPERNGGWEVRSMTFPSAGAIGNSIDQVVSYTVAQQSIHGRLEPKLATPSTIAADLRSITLHMAAQPLEARQTIERIIMNGRLKASANGRLDFLSDNTVSNWHAVALDPAGQESHTTMRRVIGNLAVTDLDRAQGARLMAALRSVSELVWSHDSEAALTPADRDSVRAVLDTMEGLLTRVEADETIDALAVNLPNGESGTLDRLRLHMLGEAREKQLHAALDLALDAPQFATLTAASAAFMPRHATARAVMAGVPIGPLMVILRNAIRPEADQAALVRQATALLNNPGAQAGVESIVFDAGPVHVSGSARLIPRPNGELGANIHISASGIDALMGRIQNQPDLQHVMPFLFMAKGMGRAQGDTLSWDISVGGGPLMINNVPMGQPSARTR